MMGIVLQAQLEFQTFRKMFNISAGRLGNTHVKSKKYSKYLGTFLIARPKLYQGINII